MSIIGNNVVGGSTPNYTSASVHELPDHVSYVYTATSNQEVHRLWFYTGGLNGDGSGVEVGVYDITSGTASAPLIASGTISSLTLNAWTSLDITPVALTEGNDYAIAFRTGSATDVSARSTYVTGGVSRSNLTGASALAATWTDNATGGNVVSVYAETRSSVPGTTFNGTDQYLDITGIDNSSGRNYFYVTMAGDYQDPTASARTFYESATSTGYLRHAANVSTISRSGIFVEINGVTEGSSLSSSNVKNGDLLTIQHWSSPETSVRFFASQAGDRHMAGTVSKIDVYNTDRTVLLHSFDLSNPASSTINDSVGSATLTLTGFAFASDASINVDIPLHIDLEWGATHELAVTHDGGTTTLSGVTLSAPTGWETVTYSGTAPDAGTTESFVEKAATDAGLGGGGYTMQAGDILAWETQAGLTIDTQTIPTVSPAATVSGSYKIWRSGISSWTSVSTFTINDLGIPGPGDTEAPVITLIGSPFVNVPLNGTYTEQGATWIDNVDGSGSAVVGGDVVDETTAGLYEVTYNYTDAGGNAATEVVRQVRVYVPGVGGLGRFRSILKPVVKGLIKAVIR